MKFTQRVMELCFDKNFKFDFEYNISNNLLTFLNKYDD
jgi:hypothetical protein